MKKAMLRSINIDFLEKHTTANSASCCQIFRENSPYLLNNPHIKIYSYSSYLLNDLHIKIYSYSPYLLNDLHMHKMWILVIYR